MLRRKSRGRGTVVSRTATTSGARDHARAQGETRVLNQPTIPPSAARDLPPGVDASGVIWDETLAAGDYRIVGLPRGGRLRLLDIEGDACAAMLLYNAVATNERLNVADTLKVQWNAYLRPGQLLLSDMGRVLVSIIEDTSGRHDAICGASTPWSNASRYGDVWPAGPPSARDRFLLAAAKLGLSRRDIPPAITLFKGVRVEADGGLTFDGAFKPGAHVTLRAELDTIVVVANTPHRLDARAEYTCTSLRLTAWHGDRTPEDDSFRVATPEGLRAFQNTEAYLGSGGAT